MAAASFNPASVRSRSRLRSRPRSATRPHRTLEISFYLARPARSVDLLSLPGRFRFKRSRSVGAYVGLTTRRHASGEIDWTGRISKCGDAMLRSYLFEAAGVLLTRVPKWSALKAWGIRLAQRNWLRKDIDALSRQPLSLISAF